MAGQTGNRRGLFGRGARTVAPAAPGPAASSAARGPAPERPAIHFDRTQILSMNQKALVGAALAPPIRCARVDEAALQLTEWTSRPARIVDVTQPHFAYWCEALQCFVRPHRKLWEFAAVLQAFYMGGVLTPGARMLGFGVGDEPIPSYLAALGLHVVATDLPGMAERAVVWRPSMLDSDAFDRQVEVSDLDIRRTDDETLRGFDGVWSCSVINELTTPDQAAEAVIHAMDTARPGGVVVHTADWAFADDQPAQRAGELVFTRAFFETLTEALNGRGHQVAPLSFDLGAHPLDAYVDQEPYTVEGAAAFEDLWREGVGAPHLKVLAGGVLTTSFALVIKRRP